MCATKDYWDFLKAYSSKWRVGTLGALLPDCLDFAEEFGDATPEELLMPCGIEHLIRWPGMLTLLDSRTCIRITPMALHPTGANNATAWGQILFRQVNLDHGRIQAHPCHGINGRIGFF